MTTKFYLADDGTPMLEFDSGVTLPIAAWPGPAPTVDVLDFANDVVTDRAEEFARWILQRPDWEMKRTKAEWWREFLAFVAMRQNFPDTSVP